MSSTYLDLAVVLYLDAGGSVVAMEDRCCHRHARLSKGRLEKDRDIIEAQQRVINLDPDRAAMAVSFDGPLTHIRRMVDQAIDAEKNLKFSVVK